VFLVLFFLPLKEKRDSRPLLAQSKRAVCVSPRAIEHIMSAIGIIKPAPFSSSLKEPSHTHTAELILEKGETWRCCCCWVLATASLACTCKLGKNKKNKNKNGRPP
jgi:hypothetical protein